MFNSISQRGFRVKIPCNPVTLCRDLHTRINADNRRCKTDELEYRLLISNPNIWPNALGAYSRFDKTHLILYVPLEGNLAWDQTIVGCCCSHAEFRILVAKIMRPENRFHPEEQLLETSAASIPLSDGSDTGVEAMDFFHCRHCATSNWVVQVLIALLVPIAFNNCKSRNCLGLDGEQANELVNSHVDLQAQDICSKI
jgi:hypothetical protein